VRPTEQRVQQRFNWSESVAIVAVASASIFKLNSQVEWLAVPPRSDQNPPRPRLALACPSHSVSRPSTATNSTAATTCARFTEASSPPGHGAPR
jgi:hypothetical protein